MKNKFTDLGNIIDNGMNSYEDEKIFPRLETMDQLKNLLPKRILKRKRMFD